MYSTQASTQAVTQARAPARAGPGRHGDPARAGLCASDSPPDVTVTARVC